MPVTNTYEGARFFVRQAGRLLATPLFLVLLIVESTDLIFAVDSIPAIFAVTQEPFIVYTSNVFAILGLRSLYFLLAGVMDKFYYLKLGLSAVLIFVGGKMLAPELSALLTGVAFKIHTAVSLGVVAGILAIAVLASLLHAPVDRSAEAGGIAESRRNPSPESEMEHSDGHMTTRSVTPCHVVAAVRGAVRPSRSQPVQARDRRWLGVGRPPPWCAVDCAVGARWLVSRRLYHLYHRQV